MQQVIAEGGSPHKRIVIWTIRFDDARDTQTSTNRNNLVVQLLHVKERKA
jgi:hypothetical protein